MYSMVHNLLFCHFKPSSSFRVFFWGLSLGGGDSNTLILPAKRRNERKGTNQVCAEVKLLVVLFSAVFKLNIPWIWLSRIVKNSIKEKQQWLANPSKGSWRSWRCVTVLIGEKINAFLFHCSLNLTWNCLLFISQGGEGKIPFHIQKHWGLRVRLSSLVPLFLIGD